MFATLLMDVSSRYFTTGVVLSRYLTQRETFNLTLVESFGGVFWFCSTQIYCQRTPLTAHLIWVSSVLAFARLSHHNRGKRHHVRFAPPWQHFQPFMRSDGHTMCHESHCPLPLWEAGLEPVVEQDTPESCLLHLLLDIDWRASIAQVLWRATSHSHAKRKPNGWCVCQTCTGVAHSAQTGSRFSLLIHRPFFTDSRRLAHRVAWRADAAILICIDGCRWLGHDTQAPPDWCTSILDEGLCCGHHRAILALLFSLLPGRNRVHHLQLPSTCFHTSRWHLFSQSRLAAIRSIVAGTGTNLRVYDRQRVRGAVSARLWEEGRAGTVLNTISDGSRFLIGFLQVVSFTSHKGSAYALIMWRSTFPRLRPEAQTRFVDS